jgi:hypothetical protein
MCLTDVEYECTIVHFNEVAVGSRGIYKRLCGGGFGLLSCF